MESLHAFLVRWNKQADSLTRLQQIYLVIAVIIFVVAGLVSLAHQQTGQTILQLAFIALGIFLVNGIIWALIHTFVVPHATPPSRPRATRKK